MTLFSRSARLLRSVCLRPLSTPVFPDIQAQACRINKSDEFNNVGEALYKGAIYCRPALILNPKNRQAITNLADCIEKCALVQLFDLKRILFQLKAPVRTVLNEKWKLIAVLRNKIKYILDVIPENLTFNRPRR